MIYGIGTDIVEVERIKRAGIKWGDKFLHRIFTRNEIEYAYEKRSPWQSLAVRFAAKEAFIKAASASVYLPLTEIEIVHTETGRPLLNPSGAAAIFISTHRITGMHVSLSHEKGHAIATVILEVTVGD